jgi:hypothetical protein
LLEALPFVNHARGYHAGFTKHATLGVPTDPKIGSEDHIYINIHLHEGVVEGGKDLFEKIRKFLTAKIVDFNDSQLRCHVPLKDIDAIAAIDQVRTVEECPSITFHDEKAVDIIYGDQPKLSVPKYKGAGQIIAVADAGFNKSSSAFVHPAFQDRLIGISDKVVLLLTEKKEREDKILQLRKEQAMSHVPEGHQPVVHPLVDPSGHSTHVAGCAVGISSKEKADKMNKNFTNIISSPAPMVKLWFQAVDPVRGKVPLLPDLITSDPEAKIHNNS